LDILEKKPSTYYSTHEKQMKLNSMRFREKNKEKIKMKSLEYYQEHKEEIKTKFNLLSKSRKKAIAKYQKLYRKTHTERAKFTRLARKNKLLEKTDV
jgi:hypothetical protein